MANKRKEKLLAYMCLLMTICFSIVFFVKFLVNISVGADDQKIIIEANLDKYINYEISDQDKGTLIQYSVRTGMEYESEDYIPLKSSELAINLNQIDGKYPYAVKVITKRTELTNGKTENMESHYEYDSNLGMIVIKTSNQDENGEIINDTKPSEEAKDEYIIIAYYDAYMEQEEERELDIKVRSTVTLSIDDRKITQENEFKGMVKDNIGELTSVTTEEEEIYNGYIKSNIINGTNYDTEYKETAQIMVSKKEAQQKIAVKESNSFERVYQNSNGEETIEEIPNNGNLVYKSTKIKQQDIKRLLGENGVVEILDGNSNLIATIDQNTQFAEDGSVVINYEDELESIIVKTSEIKDEGILPIENKKAIKSTMQNINYNKIKAVIEITGIKEEVITDGEEEIKEETEIFTNYYENISDIKESTNHINFDVSSMEWTNQYQNEITFHTYISSNKAKDNMLKNPTIKIELPSEVEKVILGESSVIYANGLELQNPYLETNENGNIVIIANLVGTQTSYDENALGLVTDVKIVATVILKKDIENTVGDVSLTYTNQYTLDGSEEVKNENKQVKIKSYQEESMTEANSSIATYAKTSLLNSTVENIEGLTVEVTPIRGDTVLKDGDTVYEGEFIKYNITVTNTSDEQIDDIKIVGSIPDGTTYGELEADYDMAFGKYDYNYYNEVKEKTIEISSLEAGKSSTKFYEVKANDLDEGEEQKETVTNIKAYIGSIETTNYEIKNVIKPADVQIFLAARKNVTEGMWTYALKVKSNIEGVAELKIQLPKEFVLRGITNADSVQSEENSEVYEIEVSDDNLMTTKINLSTEEKEYIILGNIDSLKTENQTEESKLYLNAIAKVFVNNTVYVSNENRIEYNYENVLVSMTSDSEGEEVKYEDEIEYKIEIKSIGEKDSYSEYGNVTTVNLKDYLPEDVVPISVTYQNWEIDSIAENEETETYTINEGYKKVEKTKEINGRTTDEEGNQLPDIDIDLFIPFYESSTVIIKCKAGLVEEKTKIENNATVSGDYILSKTTNTVTHTILPYNYEEGENPDDPSNPDGPDDPSNPDNPGDNDEKYSISGIAWLDENGDGKRQTNEKLLEGITVMLVNTNNSSAIKAKQVTDSNGIYRFSELEKGKYIIVFNYDTDTYSVTEYQKSGVSSSLNSDATTKEITLLGTQTKVGVTDIITLDASIQNIDIGLIKNKICDLRLDKYISKVTVKTKSGTKEQSYNDTQLAKVEIKSKEIQGAIIVVEYKIVITNEGEIPTSVNSVTDYLPDGLEFSSELNKSWTTTKKGELTNTSISNQKIDPGKSMELVLVATKTMTSNSTGTFTNIAEIGQISNSVDIKDTDSTPGNKAESEDDYSKADLIISIGTGAVLYISIILGIILMIAIVVYLNMKFGIKRITKISMFMTITVLTIFVHAGDTFAYKAWSSLPQSASWVESGVHNVNGNGYSAFTASGYGITGYCAMETFSSATGSGLSRHLDGSGKYNTITYDTDDAKSDEDISFQKANKNEDVYVVKDGDKLKIGPFQIRGNATSYTYQITGQNNTYNSPEVTNKTTNNGVTTFYLKINYTEDSIKKVRVTGYKKVTTTSKKYYKAAYAYYIPYSDAGTGTKTWTCEMGHTHTNWPITSYYNNYPYQDVMTYDRYMWTEGGETKSETKHIDLDWIIQYGDLEITKQDADDSNVKLKDVEIRVECDAANYNQTFRTDENGKIAIKNLKQGTYTITEISNPYYEYNVMATSPVTVKGGMTNTCILKNTKQTGNLKIVKQDADSKTTKYLEGVSFQIRRKDEDKYIQVKVGDEWKTECTGIIHVDDMKYVDKESDATTFITNGNGIIEIRNILKGTYEVEEVSVGDKNFGYDIDDEYINWSYTSVANDENTGSGKGHIATVAVWRRSSVNTKDPPENENRNEILTFKNKKKYIKLSGYAWEDFYYGKQSNRNNVYQGGNLTDENGNTVADNDKRLNNVPVRLVKTDGTSIETMTSEDGSFVFGDYDKNPNTTKILIEDIEEGAYIQFYYNGLNYQTVELNCIDEKGNKVENGNTAREFSLSRTEEIGLREQYNNYYGKVENNTTFREDNGKKAFSFTYNYDSENYNSTINYPSGARYGYEGANYPILTSYSNSEHSDQFYITARTETNINPQNKEDYRLFGQNRSIQEILEAGEDEITNINLGLYEREQPDLAIAQDINDVELSINGYSHTYEYANRFKDEYTNNIDKEKYPEGIYNVGVKFKTKYGSESYTRTVYESDCKYTGEDKLKAYVTYKIAINNQATGLNARVNSLVEYYDKQYYTVESAYLEDGTKLTLSPPTDVNESYKKVEINTAGLTIGTGNSDQAYVYVKFEITNIGAIFFDEESGQKLKSDIVLKTWAEINSYSTLDKDNKIYAGIDKDSNPGNFNVEAEKEENKQLEDDTDGAPSLILTADKARTISGTVFLDESVLEKVTSNPDTYTRNGNGEYDNGESTISGVKVELYETKKDDMGNIIYDENGNIAKSDTPSGITKYNNGQNEGTGNDGYFEISGFIPSDYVIVYTWGDKTYIQGDSNNPINVDDYKGTIYKESARATYEDWYRDYPEEQKWRNIRYSDATDDYGMRTAIDSYEISENSANITVMNSMTPIMKFGIEYADDIQSYTGNSTLADEQNNKLTFKIPYVDFGITERARQQMDISKKVKTVKITLANGQTIVDAEVEEVKDNEGNPVRDEKGNIKYQLVGETVRGLTYMGPSKDNIPKNGYLKAEIDSELIQGSTIEIGYEIEVKNNSEVDYDSLNYYKYGFKEGDIISITPAGVYDYLDKSMVIDKENEENSEWITMEQKQYEDAIKEYETEKTTIENYFSYIKNLKIQNENGKEETIDITGYTSSYEEYYLKITEWQKEEIKTARQKRLADKTILHNAQLENELTPGRSNTASIYVTKVLANNDEIDLNNAVEITKIERTQKTGRKVTPINSKFYDEGETVTVTPATGENRNYTEMIILVISSSILLGVGIVVIKKKVLS